MTVVLSLLFGIPTVMVAVLLVSGLAYDRWWRQRRQVGSAVGVSPGRGPVVRWLAGRWDTDPRHAYVANIGDDTAYEVSVTACDRVIGRTRSVPPYRTARLPSSSELPCYVNFCVDERLKREDERLKREIARGADGAMRSAQDNAVGLDGLQVVVQVAWRSEHGEWCTQTVGTN